jgi:hypothetical protein
MKTLKLPFGNKYTNFTNSIPVALKNKIETTCKLHVESIVANQSNGASGAHMFTGTMKAINPKPDNVIIKLWTVPINHVYDETHTSSCLDGEWKIYTYLIPFLFFNFITPNVLIPTESGVCSCNQLKDGIQMDIPKKNIAKYIMTPRIKYSVFKLRSTINMTDIYFQTLFTLAAFNKIGMRHNDCHLNNIRVVQSKTTPFYIRYKLKNVDVYCTTKNLAVLYDFDRCGIESKLVEIVKFKNLCTTYPNGLVCNTIHQCDTNVAGVRDMLILTYYIFNYLELPMRTFFYEKFFTHNANSKAYFKKYVQFDDKNMLIDLEKSDAHDFLFYNLPDSKLVMYPSIDTVLNYPHFLEMCAQFAPTLRVSKNTDQGTQTYATYSFYDLSKQRLATMYKNFVDLEK